jgi:hypothetical protein
MLGLIRCGWSASGHLMRLPQRDSKAIQKEKFDDELQNRKA